MGLLRLLAALALCFSGLTAAQPAHNPSPIAGASANVNRLSWTSVRGSAVEISIGADGAVFALDRKNSVWLRRPGDAATPWTQLPGRFKRIDAVTEKLAWGIDAKGIPHRYDGTWWLPLDGIHLRDIGSAVDGAVFAIDEAGRLVRYDGRRRFAAVGEAPDQLLRVASDGQGLPWVVRENGEVHRFDGQRWRKLPDALADISIGGGIVYGKGIDGTLLRWHPEADRWTPLAATISSVAVSAEGKPWISIADGRIYANDPNTNDKRHRLTEMPPPVFTRIVNWQHVRGDAKALAISAGSAVLALGQSGEVWRWKGKDNWSRLPGTLKGIALEPSGVPWGVDTEGRILQYSGSYWHPVPGAASDIAVGADGSIWIVQLDGVPARWESRTREWKPVEPAAKAIGIAVDPAGLPWIIGADNSVSRYDGKIWLEVPDIKAKSVALGPEGSVFVVDVDDKLQRLDRLGKRWDPINGDFATVAVGPGGQPWAATSRAEIYASSLFEERRVEAPIQIVGTSSGKPLSAGTNAVPTSKESLSIASFQLIPNFTGRNIAIGNDGSVFALAFDGTLARWNNGQKRFLSFPGLFARIAVAPDGKPWGVTGRGEVWRHDGNNWQVVKSVQAQDIGIGLNGTKIVAGLDEVLYRYVASEDRFERMRASHDGEPAPVGSRIAIDPQGQPWTITNDNVIRRCDRQPCERLVQTAREIGIGPNGSVFIVDMDYRLRRYDKASGDWERIGIDAATVAVGPGEKPWLVNGKSEIWSSAFFRRDESGDIAVAAASSTIMASAAGAVSTTPVFTFSVTMPFDTIPTPIGFMGGGDINLAFTPSGSLVAVDVAFGFWNYDENLKRFVMDTSIPSIAPLLGASDTRSFVIGKDGSYWLTNDSGVTPKVWRRLPGAAWQQIQGLDDCSTTPGCGSPSAMSLAIAPDGTIYATSSGDNIARFDTAIQRFVNVSISRPNASGAVFVNVDPNGRFWAASPAPTRLYEFVGNAWVLRTNSVIGNPGVCLFTKVPCVSISATGAAYGYGAAFKPVRWSPAAGTWETITSSPSMPGNSTYAAAPDGRLWVWTGTTLHRSR